MWFRELVGFDETTAAEVRDLLRVDGERMISSVNGREMACGSLDVISLADLRHRAAPLLGGSGKSMLREVIGDVGVLHRDPQNAGATFQAASQFNLLEMVSPEVTPEDGVDGYEHDRTQGPVCAVACGAGTIYRNYFVEVDGQRGQTADNQIDCLEAIGRLLFPEGPTAWTMNNGYALFDGAGLDQINARLDSMTIAEIDAVRAALRVGVHRDVEVTTAATGHLVTQVYCSALPVEYNREPSSLFEPFARLILDATYEATVLAGAINAARTGNRTVFLTLVGGGVFGNEQPWIINAIERAASTVGDAGLDLAIVSYGSSKPAIASLVEST